MLYRRGKYTQGRVSTLPLCEASRDDVISSIATFLRPANSVKVGGNWEVLLTCYGCGGEWDNDWLGEKPVNRCTTVAAVQQWVWVGRLRGAPPTASTACHPLVSTVIVLSLLAMHFPSAAAPIPAPRCSSSATRRSACTLNG